MRSPARKVPQESLVKGVVGSEFLKLHAGGALDSGAAMHGVGEVCPLVFLESKYMYIHNSKQIQRSNYLFG